MTDFDQVKKLASKRRRTIPLCVDGASQDEHEVLERRLAATPPPVSLGDTTRRDLAEQIVAVEERMREATFEFKLEALPVRGEGCWESLVGKQPDRDDGESDDAFRQRLFPWFAEVVSRTVIDPVMTPDQVGELVDDLNEAAWMELINGCLELNRGLLNVPNSSAASELIGTSGQT